MNKNIELISIVNDKEIKGFFGDYRWLSNFYPCKIKLNGLIYDNAEAVYQSFKFPLLERAAFVGLDGYEAKKAGKKAVINTDEWNDLKEGVMILVVTSKFSQNPELKAKLAETGNKYLEETNNWKDTHWGVYEGFGANRLGRIIMNYRRLFIK